MKRKFAAIPLLVLAGGALVLAGCDDKPTISVPSSTEPTSSSTSEGPAIVDPDPSTPYMDAPVDGAALKLGLYQQTKETYLWYTGEMDGYYFASSEKWADAVDVVSSKADGGWTLQVGSQYIAAEVSGTHNNIVLSSSEFVWEWHEDKDYFSGMCGDKEVYIGNYSNYDTFSLSTIDHLDGEDTNLARLFLSEPAAEPIIPDEVATYVDTPVSGTTYAVGMYNPTMTRQWYLLAKMSGHYGASTREIEEADGVLVTEGEHGWTLQMTSGEENGKYIAVVISGTFTNFAFQENPFYWEWNEEHKTFLGSPAGSEALYFMGTTGEYNTFNVVANEKLMDETASIAHLYEGGKTETPEEPEEPVVLEGETHLALSFDSAFGNTDGETGGLTNSYLKPWSTDVTDEGGAIASYNMSGWGLAKQKDYLRLGGKAVHADATGDEAGYGYFQIDTATTSAIAGINLDVKNTHSTFTALHVLVDDAAFPAVPADDAGTTSLPEGLVDHVEVTSLPAGSTIAIVPSEGVAWAAGSYFRIYVEKADGSNNGGVDFTELRLVEAAA